MTRSQMTRSQLHIDFGVPFMYSVLEVRHIFWSSKAHVAFHFAAAVLFLRLIMHLNLLSIAGRGGRMYAGVGVT